MNEQQRVELLKNRIRQLRHESIDIEFIQYLNNTEVMINKAEYPIDYFEREVERNYTIYLQKNGIVRIPQNKQKGSFEFSIGAGLLSVVGILFILAGLIILSVNYMNGFAKGISMCVIAVAVIIFSEIYIKKKQIKIANAVTGIGLCVLFAATVANAEYFHYIVTLVLVFLSALVTLIFCKRKDSVLYKYISILGSYICLYPSEGVMDGWAFVIICLLLFVIHMAAILIPLKKESRGFMITGMIWNLIYLFLFVALANEGGIESGYIIVHILLAAIVFWVHALKTTYAKENGTGLFLLAGTFAYYLVLTDVLRDFFYANDWYYIGIVLGFFLIVQIFAVKKSAIGIAAAVLIGTFIQYVFHLGETNYIDLAILGAFGISLLLIKQWKLFYQLVITLAFLLYPLAHSAQWSVIWQSDLNILLCSGILIALFLISNHAKWLYHTYTYVYNWICISILAVMQLAMFGCDSLFVFSFMLIIGLTIFEALLRERYRTGIKNKEVWMIVYLTYMGLNFPNDNFIIINIVMTVIALCSVIIGFAKKHKGIRIYGLLLALFICAKIVIYDCRTVSHMNRIMLFIGVGVVILAISFVYTRLEKRLQQD